MVPYMEKTTLYLDGADYRRLKKIAQARKVAPASLVREAVAEYVARHGARALPKSLGAGDSGRRDLGERAEDLLAGLGTVRPRTRRDRR
jgi:predicted transcriptional regulator